MFDENTMIVLQVLGLPVTALAVIGAGFWTFLRFQQFSVRTRVVLMLLEGVAIATLAALLLFVVPK